MDPDTRILFMRLESAVNEMRGILRSELETLQVALEAGQIVTAKAVVAAMLDSLEGPSRG